MFDASRRGGCVAWLLIGSARADMGWQVWLLDVSGRCRMFEGGGIGHEGWQVQLLDDDGRGRMFEAGGIGGEGWQVQLFDASGRGGMFEAVGIDISTPLFS
jgi:hypothetical protein